MFLVVKSTSHETNGARKNRLDGRQKWLEPTWNAQVDLKSTPRSEVKSLHFGLSMYLDQIQLNFGLSMYLDHTFARKNLSEITSLFGLSRYLDRTFAQRIGSAKVKSKSEVAHFDSRSHYDWLTLQFRIWQNLYTNWNQTWHTRLHIDTRHSI